MVILFKYVLLLAAIINGVFTDEHSHKYEPGEEVVIWMNTIGPYDNRQETYRYFSLPFCRGPLEGISHYHETLGEALQGVELEFSGLDVKFQTNVGRTLYCSVEVDVSKINKFLYIVRNHYWYQMYIDDLPVWGIVGDSIIEGEEEKVEKESYIYTHKKFDIGYNGNQIVDVNLTTGDKVTLNGEIQLDFTYEVNWKPSSITFHKRYDKYLDARFFKHRIHWFSIFNSFMMVLFLVGLVVIILLRALRKDYARYTKDEETDMEQDLGDEYGWKQIHGDVFRAPDHPIIFCSLIGTGYHLFFVGLCSIVFALIGDSYTHRGGILSTAIFVYSFFSPICGFTGGALYSRLGGRHWIRQMTCGVCLFPSLITSVSLSVNVFAMYYHASKAIPITSMLSVIGIALFIIFPLNLIGTILGRNLIGQPDTPCRVNTVPRPIPEKKWFLDPCSLVFLGGILPFGSIFIEVYFIFTSFWQYKIYYVFGFMLLVFLIMLAVTVCVTVVCIYFLVNSEDFRWYWTSFGTGASISMYIFVYSIYYFFFKTK
jgi:transmembrane 9 superfamily protein 3